MGLRRGAVLAGLLVVRAATAPAHAAVLQAPVPATAPVLHAQRIAHVRGWTFSAVGTADVGHDGRRDVIALDIRHRGVAVMRSLGGGRWATRLLPDLFLTRPRSGAGISPELVVADLDRDGRPDLVVIGRRVAASGPALVVRVAYGTRNGFAPARATRVIGGNPVARLAVGDADGDHRPDVILGVAYGQAHRHVRGDGLLVLRGRPGRRLARRVRPTTAPDGVDPHYGVELLTADLNADGALDIVFRGALFRGLGRGRFVRAMRVAPVIHEPALTSSQRLLSPGGQNVLAAVATPPHNATPRLEVVARGTRPVAGGIHDQWMQHPGLG